MLYLEPTADRDGKVTLKLTFRVTRREVRAGTQGFAKPGPGQDLSRFLQADALVPIGGKPLELLKDRTLPADAFGAARVLYDVVNQHMRYSKEGIGWGRGDVVWVCDSKYGNCTDFHSLFISLARSHKIPAKFEIGFPMPPERGAGKVGGYHCWAWFLPEGKGWVPVDISEANRNPKLREYYFGNLTEDRVTFTTGRDLDLVPRQAGPPLNYFIYPHVEVDGQPYPAERVVGSFSYEDVAGTTRK
jgi:transglutaminase-like putative cysteine protease